MKNNIEILSTKKYQWNQNWANRIAHIDINLVVTELNDIYETRGQITPDLIVESAKNKKSVLHEYFEWDDSIAANKWRMRQASKLLGCIEVVVISDNQPKTFRVYQTTNKIIGNGDTGYIKFDAEAPNISYIKSLCFQHLSSVEKRLYATGLFASVLVLVRKSIEELQKSSGETTTESPVMTIGNKAELILSDK